MEALELKRGVWGDLGRNINEFCFRISVVKGGSVKYGSVVV